MYVLVYAPCGIVGEDGSSARLFDTYQEAYGVMRKEASYDPEVPEDQRWECGSISDWHATDDTSDPDAAEWHIYEV